MLKGLRVPTHRIDAPGLFIFPWDDAWDVDRIKAEREELAAQALAKMQAEARETMARELGRELTDEEKATADESCVLTEAEHNEASDRHPVPRYLAGDTRFDPKAKDQSPRGPATAWDYLREGSTPTVFTLRRVGFQTRMRLEAVEMRDKGAALIGWCKAGVESITCGDETLWKSAPDKRELPDEWLESIAATDGGAFFSVMKLAEACQSYSKPLDPQNGGR